MSPKCLHESWDVGSEYKVPGGWRKSRKCNDCGAPLLPITEPHRHFPKPPPFPPTVKRQTGDLTRVIGSAAPLIALALADTYHFHALNFTYTDTAVIVRPNSPTDRTVNREALVPVEKAFTEAGWEQRVRYINAAESRVYTAPWLLRL